MYRDNNVSNLYHSHGRNHVNCGNATKGNDEFGWCFFTLELFFTENLEAKMKWLKNFERVQQIQQQIIWQPITELEPRAFIPEVRHVSRPLVSRHSLCIGSSNILVSSVTCRRSVVFSRYSGFLHQKTDFIIIISPPWYDPGCCWGVKLQYTKPNQSLVPLSRDFFHVSDI